MSFALGIFSLLLAMAAAIITYLSSKFRIGLHYSVGGYLRQPTTDTRYDVHIRRVVGSYASIVKENKRVIEVNSKRFRRTLYFLLTGVLFLTTAGILYLGRVQSSTAWITVAGATGLAVFAGWYVLTGKYLTFHPIDTDNE